MKKILAIVLFAIMILSCAAYAEAPYTFDAATTGKNPEKDSYYFVFIPKLVHPFYDACKKGIDDAVADYAEMGIKISYDWDCPAAADAVVQAEKVENCVVKNPDAICVSVNDPNIMDPIMSEVLQAGVPVMTFTDDGNDKSSRLAFCGVNQFYANGVTMGEELAKAMNYEGEVAMLVGILSAQPQIDRVNGIKEALSKYENIKIVAEVADNDDIETAVQLTEQLLSAYPNLKAITTCNGGGAPGASRAVKDAGKTDDIIIIGFDALAETLEGIRDGSIFMTMAQDTRQTGYYTVQMLIDMADGQFTETVGDVVVDQYVITKDNIDEIEDKVT